MHNKRIIHRDIKPQNILEFGGGASTVFIAEVLRLNERDYNIKGKCISFENSEKYYNSLMENFTVDILLEDKSSDSDPPKIGSIDLTIKKLELADGLPDTVVQFVILAAPLISKSPLVI